MNKIFNKLKNGIVVLDGATGTELQKRGMPIGVSPEIWCLENPDILKAVQLDYARAGSNVVYTCTFGANSIKLLEYGKYNARSVNRRLAKISRSVLPDNVLLAGGIGPTGKFVEPFGTLKFDQAVAIFKEQAKGLIEGGVDLIVIETMMDIQEARAALIAVKEISDIFTVVTMTYEKGQRTLNGTDPVSSLVTLQSLGADAIGCNCSLGPKQMVEIIKKMKPFATVPLVAKPNAGMPQFLNGKTSFDMDAKEFSLYGPSLVLAGANMIGGCCGTTPDHIKGLKKKVSKSKVKKPQRLSISAISSSRTSLILEGKRPMVVVGERINPTGKKELQKQLSINKMSLVRQMALDQKKNGAKALDVNVGGPGIDELKALANVVKLLSIASDLPLVIDSSNPKAIEAALRVYPGRALINSISGEEDKLKILLPIARKYGAMFVLLPLERKGIPKTFAARKKIVRYILGEAKKYGIKNADIVIDGMVMTVSSKPKAALNSLEAITWARDVLKCNTIVGLSNVSFGLPNRQLINSTFLSIAKKSGLTMVIANPNHNFKNKSKKAEDVLLNKDKDAARFIAYSNKSNKVVATTTQKEISPQEKIYKAIMNGNRDDISECIKVALASKIDSQKIVNDVMIVAITEVGDLFDKKKYFLPQLIASAETMKKGFEYLKPYLKKTKSEDTKKTVVVLATVEGDIHDIGKNIVGLMLKNHGFEVVDLGRNVSPKKIVQEIKRHKHSVVGLSALMTTTMVNMKNVMDCAKKEKLNCRFIVGGAAITEKYAKSLDAEYASDGVSAVRKIQKISISFSK